MFYKMQFAYQTHVPNRGLTIYVFCVNTETLPISFCCKISLCCVIHCLSVHSLCGSAQSLSVLFLSVCVCLKWLFVKYRSITRRCNNKVLSPFVNPNLRSLGTWWKRDAKCAKLKQPLTLLYSNCQTKSNLRSSLLTRRQQRARDITIQLFANIWIAYALCLFIYMLAHFHVITQFNPCRSCNCLPSIRLCCVMDKYEHWASKRCVLFAPSQSQSTAQHTHTMRMCRQSAWSRGVISTMCCFSANVMLYVLYGGIRERHQRCRCRLLWAKRKEVLSPRRTQLST